VALTAPAPVNESTTQSTPDQRQSMTGALAWNPKIATRSPPFGSVRQNPSARAKMRQQMGQLMAQRSIDFSGPEFLQSRVKQNEAAPEIRTTDGGAHAIVPVHS
jgi:hypothetical protein